MGIFVIFFFVPPGALFPLGGLQRNAYGRPVPHAVRGDIKKYKHSSPVAAGGPLRQQNFLPRPSNKVW